MTRNEIIALYRQHARRLFNMSLRITGDAAEAEEVMQDTILKFVSRPLRPSGEAQVSAWLSRSCIRASIDRLRRRRREELFLAEYAASQERVEAEETDTDAIDPARVYAAMQSLPDPYRLVVTLVLAEGLDYDEIAAFTGQKPGTLRSLFSRGRQKLVQLLREDGKQV